MDNVIVGKESFICEDTKCYTLEYYLLVHKNVGDKDDCNPVYGMEIKKIDRNTVLESAKVDKFTRDKNQVTEVIKMLRKNIVTPISLHEVIEDLKAS